MTTNHDEDTGCLVDGCLFDVIKFLGIAAGLFTVAGCGIALLIKVIV